MKRKRLLPLLIGALCLAQVIVGGAAASSIRSDHRKAAAIAKEKRDVAAFRAALVPIALGVFDVVQPLQDVVDDPSFAQPFYPQLRDDVLDRSGAVATLAALHVRLTNVSAPRSRRESLAAFTKGMTELVSAAKLMAAATHAKGDRSGYVRAFGPAFDTLSTGTSFWTIALSDEFGAGKVAAPSSKRVNAAGRRTSSKGGFVGAADRACGTAFVSLDALPERHGFAFVQESLPKHIVINDHLHKSLRSIAVPADAPARRLTTMLAALAAFTEHERGLVTASRSQDPAVFEAARQGWLGDLPAVRDLSHAFGEYGATLCRDYLDVTDVLAPSGSDAKPDLSA